MRGLTGSCFLKVQHHLETENVRRVHRELNKISIMLQVSVKQI